MTGTGGESGPASGRGARTILVALAPALSWAAIVLGVSSIPAWHLQAPALPGLDKLIHFSEYMILSLLAVGGLARAARPRRGTSSRGSAGRLAVILSVPVMLAMAALDELHQRWIPGRSPDVLDFAADAAGVIAGVAVVLVVARLRSTDT